MLKTPTQGVIEDHLRSSADVTQRRDAALADARAGGDLMMPARIDDQCITESNTLPLSDGAPPQWRQRGPRLFPDRKLVKVWREPKRRATCKFCGEQVVWLKTVNRERFMLFDGDATALMRGADAVRGEPVEYYDRADCHWETCPSLQASMSETVPDSH
jgi:hypothetical protein